MKSVVPDVVVIGTILKETIYFSDGRIVGPVLGSPAAYSGIVMAAQGVSVGILSYYGNDFPEAINDLSALNLDNMISHTQTTTNDLLYLEDGSKRIRYISRSPMLEYELLNDHYLKSSYFYICPMDYEVDLDLIERLYHEQKTVFVDMGGFGGATSDVRYSIETDYGKRVVQTIAKNCTILKASNEDLASIAPNHTTEEAAQLMTDFGARKIVVTCGKEGAFYKQGENDPVYFPPFLAVSEEDHGQLDFTGAGDSFGAGFMVSYTRFGDIGRAITHGNATASLVKQQSGGSTLARLPNIERVMRRIESGE